ncbi:DUF4118 domain-containing protein [Methylomonas koyamae]|uniref:DUF4118 domain-containing protein n=1 Tax=Methylomonas koyamae TaxID=702114 RepID=UPI0009EE6399|nr:DUF4118 domain-containing protein [Methylomonas koyamae]
MFASGNRRWPGKFGPDAQLPARTRRERVTGYACGVAAPFVCTLAAWPFRSVLEPASILMSYMLGVFLVASRYGRGPSLTASLMSPPVFAYYFAPPIFSFAISDLENIVGLAVMIVVASLTSNLLDRARSQAEIARQRENRANALYRLSRALADAHSREAIAALAAARIRDEFATAAAILAADDNRSLPLSPFAAWPDFDPESARQTFAANALRQCRDTVYYPLAGSQAVFGVLLVKAEPFTRSAHPEALALFETFRNLIGQALERLYLAERAREAGLQVQAEALRNALLSAISHDLRTPLTRISGAAGALIDNADRLSAAERQEFYRAVLDEAQRMAELTSKILDMARLSSGEITLHCEWNALEEIVGSALARLDKALRERPVRIQIPDSLPLLWVDAVLFEQVLANLIENTIKYTPPGSPIDIGAELAADGLQLAVTDYGAGIPDGMQDKIFDKFYRLGGETEPGGVGLGLALCRTIVAAHGGRIRASNAAGKGASLVIELPLREPPALDWSEPEERGG